MGDAAAARRNLMWVKMAIDDRRYDQLDDRIAKVEGDLSGLPEDEQAPIREELAGYRRAGDAAVALEKAKTIEAAIRRNISAADPSSSADRVADALKRATEMLEAQDARKYLSEDTTTALRAQIALSRGDSVETRKKDAMNRIEDPLSELEGKLASDPFKGADSMSARRTWQELTGLVGRVRGYAHALPEDDDSRALSKKLDEIEASIAQHSGVRDREEAMTRLKASWEQAKEECAGWLEERVTMTWDAFAEARGEHFGIPQTLKAVRALGRWVEDTCSDVKSQYKDDAEVVALNGEGLGAWKEAAAKGAKAVTRILEDLENLRAPTDRREDDKPARLVREIEAGLADTPLMTGLRDRTAAVRNKWAETAQKYEDEGKALYVKLSAEADWPAIAQSIKAEEGFDPTKPDAWRGKTIRLDRVRNRSGWDFDGEHDFAMHIDGVAVAGNYEMKISNAMRDMVRRTRNSIDDHQDWDVIAVIEGTGTVKQRVHTEVWIEEKKEKVTVESWNPFPCVTMRVIALHAGPVAVGPRS